MDRKAERLDEVSIIVGIIEFFIAIGLFFIGIQFFMAICLMIIGVVTGIITLAIKYWKYAIAAAIVAFYIIMFTR